jgi:hypothetical protein
MKLKIILFLIILSLIPVSNAGVLLISDPDNQVYSYVVGNGSFNSQSDQIIINIPYQEFNGVSYIDKIKLQLGHSSPHPNQDLAIRIYKTNNNNFNHSFNTVDYYHINASTLGDFGAKYTLNLDAPIYITQNTSESISIGIYTESTTGRYYIFGSNQITYYIGSSIYYSYIRDYQNNYVSGYELYLNDSNTILSLYHQIYGGYVFPTTPNPTPAQTGNGNGSLPCLPPECGGNFPNGTGSSGFNPSFNDSNSITVPCPDCIGNESISVPNTIPSNSGVGEILKGIGYCSNLGCTIDDIIAFLYDFSIIGFWISVIIIIWKGYKVYKQR